MPSASAQAAGASNNAIQVAMKSRGADSGRLTGTTAARHIALFWRSDRYHSAAAQAFVETTAAVCRAQARQPVETPLR